MRGQGEKMVHVQSEFSEKRNNEKHKDSSKESSISNEKKGRPCKDKDELRTRRVKLNCNEKEKHKLYEHYGDSGKMREFLLKAIKDGEK